MAAVVLLASAAPPARAQVDVRIMTVVVTLTNSTMTLAPIAVPTGTVVFRIVNKGTVARDFRIGGRKTPKIAAGKSATLQVAFTTNGLHPSLSVGQGHVVQLAGTLDVFALGGSTAGLPLRAVARVPLSGPAVRFDYASIDPTTDTLWISHMNAGQLLAFDVRRRRIIKTIPAPGVHGVIAVPEVGRVYASATDSQEVFTIDSHTGAVLAQAPAGQYPDGLAWDPVERHVFISDESGGVETVINTSGHRIATIPLGGGAGNVQYDAGSHRILVDVQTRNDIAVIDPRTNRIVRRVPVPGCASDHGLYVDSARRLAFVACDQNATLLTLDLRSMTVTGSASVGPGPDVLAFDSSLRRLYVSAESGWVAVFAETKNGLHKLGQAFVAVEAHTVAVDPRTHLVYFPLERGSTGRPELLIMRPT